MGVHRPPHIVGDPLSYVCGEVLRDTTAMQAKKWMLRGAESGNGYKDGLMKPAALILSMEQVVQNPS